MIALLDSSALVAHALRLPGATEVQVLLEDESNEILLSSLSLFELAGVLKLHGASATIAEYWRTYREIASEVLAPDADLVQAAWELREKIGRRIPITDAIIAATAQSHDATLVHRDQHLAVIPISTLPQLILPAA